MTHRLKPLTTAELNRIIARFGDGQGVTVAVKAFADAVPVAERTVWYWLGGRTIHPAMQERIRQVVAMKPTSQSGSAKKKADHEYGAQSSPVRPFLKAAYDKLAKKMGDKIKADYRKMLQQQAAKTVLRETGQARPRTKPTKKTSGRS